ncbi:MAG TPA: O-antigen ligase family protein [Candidatus Deferrimicrobiaceae bacterium]
MLRIGSSRKGGSDAAFPFFFFFFLLLLVAIVDTGKLFSARLGFLRLAIFAAAARFLWKSRNTETEVGAYPLIVGGFVFLALGHAFSSVYFWVSLQHGVNIAMAAVLLGWAHRTFRAEPERAWEGAFLSICGIAALQFAIALYQRVADGSIRPRGTFDNANFLSEFLAVAAVLCLSRCLARADRKGVLFASAAGVALFLGAALTLSASRAILIAAIPAAGILFLWRFGWRKGGILLVAGGLPVLAAVGYQAAIRFTSPDPYNYARLVMWKSALRTFLSNPFGVGLGGYKYFWFATQSPVEGAFLKHAKYASTAHSEYLEVLAGLGAAGFVLFLLVLLVPMVLAARNFRRVEEERKWAVAAAAACLAVSGIHAAFDFNFHEIGLVVPGAILLGALLAALPPGPSRIRYSVPPWMRLAGAGAAVLLLVVSAATAAGKGARQFGESRLRGGDVRGAERMFRAAAAIDPFCDAYPDALAALAYRFYREEASAARPDARRAEEFLSESIRWESRAISLAPRDFDKVSRLSRLYADRHNAFGRASDLREAIGLAGRAQELNPYGAGMLWERAELLLREHRTEEAAADLARAVSVEPNFCRGYAKLSELRMPSDPAEAAGWAEREQACRRRAKSRVVEEHEKWLVESPEG